MAEECLICERIRRWRAGDNPYVIAEFTHSVFVVGDHQFHRGYCLLLLKEHVRELHELSPVVQQALFEELMRSGRAVFEAFEPWKMNYACYGNAEEHVHWHIFPRYDSESDHRRNPWLHSAEFTNHLLSPDQAREIASRVQDRL
jgi:diadenosine tetraphosphate (Ap4A) HIT family hydrolase